MTIDVDTIKSALDDFENEKFVDSKEKITKEIKGAVSDYLKDKLGIKITGIEDKKDKEDDDNDSDADIDSDTDTKDSDKEE